MATVFKTLTNNDVASTRTLLHEAIPLTGTIISGTYANKSTARGSEFNVKNYAHEMFQSVYDYPYLSSSANHIFDLTVGYATSSTHDNRSDSSYHDKKVNTYNQMAQILMGYDHTASIRLFDQDGDLTGGPKIKEALFVNFARLLVKDEIKKGSFSMTFGTGSSFYSPMSSTSTNGNALEAGGDHKAYFKLGDTNAQNAYKVNSPAGEYGILYKQSPSTDTAPLGLVFYQAGIAVINLSGSAITGSSAGVDGSADTHAIAAAATSDRAKMDAHGVDAIGYLTGAYSQEANANAWRNRIEDITFNNTVELNSTVYFCRANHNEFNYSSNPTYVTGSKIQVKNVSTDSPVSYVTSVGLYSADNELLAVAKLSEPLKKDPTNEITLRVRLDY